MISTTQETTHTAVAGDVRASCCVKDGVAGTIFIEGPTSSNAAYINFNPMSNGRSTRGVVFVESSNLANVIAALKDLQDKIWPHVKLEPPKDGPYR